MAGQSVSIVGPSGSITVNPEADSEFKKTLEGKSETELKGMLDDEDLKPEERRAILEKLAEIKKKDLDEDDAKELDRLMGKLKRGEKLTDDEQRKLAGFLGVDEKELDKAAGGQTVIEGPSGKIVVNGDGTSTSTQYP